MSLCAYQNIFGTPGQGLHTRFCGVAIFDVLLTIGVSYGISRWTKKNFWLILLIMFMIGEILHYIFCVKTAFMTWLLE